MPADCPDGALTLVQHMVTATQPTLEERGSKEQQEYSHIGMSLTESIVSSYVQGEHHRMVWKSGGPCKSRGRAGGNLTNTYIYR
jgi:hypothetical protein